MKRCLLSVVLFVFFVSGSFSGFAYADTSCASCNSKPGDFALYESFVTEILSKMQTTGTKGDFTGVPVSPSWFQRGVFEIPDQNKNILIQMVSGVERNFKIKSQTLGATTAILFSLGKELLGDGVGGFLLLFKSEAFISPWKSLLDLDVMIHDEIFSLGRAGAWNEVIDEENRQYLQETLNKYSSDSYKLFDNATLAKGARYKHITSMLLRTNTAMKTFIASDVIVQFKDKDFTKGAQGKLIIKFDYNVIENMQEYYSCARGVQGFVNCDKAMKLFLENMKKVGGSFVKGAEDSRNTIDEANDKLGMAFDTTVTQLANIKSDQEFTDEQIKYLEEEAQLLQTLYGVQTRNMIDDSILSQVTSFRETIVDDGLIFSDWQEQQMSDEKYSKKKRKEIDESKKANEKKMDKESKAFIDSWGITALDCLNGNKKHFALVNSYINEIDPDVRKSIVTCEEVISVLNFAMGGKIWSRDNLYSAIALASNSDKNLDLKKILVSGMGSVIVDHQQANKSFDLARNMDVTIFYADLFDQIHILREMIGDKDSPGILQNLGVSCELQCENKGGLCWYE